MAEEKSKVVEGWEDTTKEEKKIGIEEVRKTFKNWLYIEDTDFIDVTLAVGISERIEGDPVWLFLIAPPGSTKTETARSFFGLPGFYSLDNLTSHTFISGLYVTKAKPNSGKDLLPQLNKQILVIKDFTTVLDKNKDERKEIMGQLRSIYDGYYEQKFGTMQKKIGYKSQFGIIACVTPIIDKHWKLMQQLGERFLKFRINADPIRATRKSFENEGKEVKMREEINESIRRFLENVDVSEDAVFPKKFKSKLINLANFIAVARTPISIKSGDSFYFEYIPTPELPTRLVKQLKRMAKLLALIRGKKEVTEEEMKLLIKIGKHTLPQDRLAILEYLAEAPVSDLDSTCEAINMPKSTANKILEQLWRLKLIKKTGESDDFGKYCTYELLDIVKRIIGKKGEKKGLNYY